MPARGNGRFLQCDAPASDADHVGVLQHLWKKKNKNTAFDLDLDFSCQDRLRTDVGRDSAKKGSGESAPMDRRGKARRRCDRRCSLWAYVASV